MHGLWSKAAHLAGSTPRRMIRINDILDRLQEYDPEADLDLVRKAYVWSAKLHKNQLRRSGIPYLSHPLEVAGILTELKLNEAALAASLLHDTVEDSAITIEELEKEFGSEIAALVDGVTKIGRISRTSRPEVQAENFRKMIIAMAKDIRVILIKLADRLHNMRTLEFLPEDKQRLNAEETIEIYAPIAHRLGISWIKAELEDLSFRFLNPDVYFRLVKMVARAHKENQEYLEQVRQELEKQLKESGLNCQVYGRGKHLYSINEKMKKRKLEFDQVHDLFGFRIICPTIRECYETLYVIHSIWTPVPRRIKDFIALPKTNMYQSLHTTVIGPEGRRIEIQIRTPEMHLFAEYGIAAHWRYKEGGPVASGGDDQQFDWLRRWVEFHKELKDPHQFLDSVRADLMTDEVYVFTPKGDLKVFPKGATLIDFSYSIHSDLGDHAVGARVNRKIVPLSYELQSGDIVEIITSREAQPLKTWLDFAVTPRARTKIHHFLKGIEFQRSHELGRQILESELLPYDLHIDELVKSGELDRVAGRYNFADYQKLFQEIGFGKFPASKVLSQLVPPGQLRGGAVKNKKARAKKPVKKPEARVQKEQEFVHETGIIIDGMDSPLIQLAECRPLPGEDIVAFIEEDRGIVIHRANCSKVVDLNPDRRVQARWAKKIKGTRPVSIEVVGVDRPGILAEITGAISSAGADISRATARTTADQKGINTFEIKVRNIRQLQRVVKRLEKINDVISVKRIPARAPRA